MATPNILIILADDVGVDTLRINKTTKNVTAHLTGLTDSAGPVPLPAIKRLLAAGVHFEHAWSHPVCTPTRASLWTGLQAWKTRLGYASGGLSNLKLTAVGGTAITSFAQALKADGTYRCAMFGKWDLGFTMTPVQWGWDTFAGSYAGRGLRRLGMLEYGFPTLAPVTYADLEGTTDNVPSKLNLAKAMARRLADEYKFNRSFLDENPDLRYYIGHKDTVGSDGVPKPAQSPLERKFLYATEDQVEDTKQWIASQKGKGPWCVTLCLYTPHDPVHLPPPGTFSRSLLTDPAKPTVQEMLVAMLQSMDHYLGNLLEAIDDELAQTVIIFTGDNGTQDFDPDSNEGIDTVLGDDKSTRAVGAVQIPMIIADGGLMKGVAPCYLKGAPRTVTQPVHIIDLYHTALSIAGVESAAPTDSISMAPHLTNTAGTKRTLNFSQMYDNTATVLPGGVMMPSRGINASIFDGTYRLTCMALLGGPSVDTYYVDEWGNTSLRPVFSYELSTVEPVSTIPGAFVDVKVPSITRRGDAFEVLDLAAEAKIRELYQAISQERLDNKDTRFPVIRAAPLVANWQMGEGAGTQLLDRSGYDHHTTVAPADWDAAAQHNPYVLRFDGTGAIKPGKGPALAGKTPFTLSAWIKTHQAGVIVQQRDAVDFDGQYQLRVLPDGTVVFSVFGDGVSQFNIITTTKVNDGKWHHITAVRDGEDGFIYLDGDLTPAAQGSGTARNLKSTIAVGIGGDIRDNANFYKGAMFDLRIYRVALTPSEIALDLVQPLVGHWPLDENAGKEVFDRVPPRPKSAITGKAAWVDAPHGLLFDGASYIDLGTTASLAGKVSFTLSAWIQTTRAGTIIQQRDESGFEGQYMLSVNTKGTVQFVVFGDGAYQFNFGSTIKVNDGKWHHVAAIRDGENGAIYIDGVLAGQRSGTARNLKSTISVAVGADIRDKKKFFTGQIREVRVYKAALSEEMIDALFDAR